MRHFVFGDSHTIPGVKLDYADWIGDQLLECRPDVVVDLGDTADMSSLCSYEKGKAMFQGRSYRADVDVHNEFQDRVWHKVRKQKKKLPRRIRLIGNHEERISRALQVQPELAGAIGYTDLELEQYYDTVVYYEGNTPGSVEVDGVRYSHYFCSGAMGRAIQSEHTGYQLLCKKHTSCTQGHSHALSYCVRSTAGGRKLMGLVAPMACPHRLDYAGSVNDTWDRGIIIKDNVEDGAYDLKVVRM